MIRSPAWSSVSLRTGTISRPSPMATMRLPGGQADVAGAAAERGRVGGDGDLDDLVAAERSAGRVGECFGVLGGEVGCDGAVLDLGGGGAHAGGERLEHVLAGDPALEVLPVVGDYGQPVVVVQGELP